MYPAKGIVVTVLRGSVCPVDGILIALDGLRSLAKIGIGATEDVVGTHLFVGRTVAVEILRKAEGQRVVGHQAVGTVLSFQLLKLETLTGAVATGGDKQACH